ncbi:hypothetical protein RFI_26943 [Reticulomyxa filosa]|uniref:Uncharacterized protein n=1 Tax=Reticulomyxa filosa TaxID=46433 RepID=X6M8X0_RETFI|nr:hypothetical protein RFI_26943 [Reticulomyxa filosa]|eukprot:ETO10433.1 hypothetical protein RFI_26943 [Reticulomyxa filosa]
MPAINSNINKSSRTSPIATFYPSGKIPALPRQGGLEDKEKDLMQNNEQGSVAMILKESANSPFVNSGIDKISVIDDRQGRTDISLHDLINLNKYSPKQLIDKVRMTEDVSKLQTWVISLLQVQQVPNKSKK